MGPELRNSGPKIFIQKTNSGPIPNPFRTQLRTHPKNVLGPVLGRVGPELRNSGPTFQNEQISWDILAKKMGPELPNSGPTRNHFHK